MGRKECLGESNLDCKDLYFVIGLFHDKPHFGGLKCKGSLGLRGSCSRLFWFSSPQAQELIEGIITCA